MEGLLIIALGALAVVAAPLVPGVRPLAKSAVKGGMALGGAAVAAAAAAGQQWDHLADKMGSKQSEIHLPVVESTATAVAEPVQAAAEAATKAPAAAAAVASTVPETVSTAAEAAPAAPVAGAVEATSAAVEAAAAAPVEDDLTNISGIGTKTVAVLAAAGITTYAQLAAATEAGLREILESAGSRYRLLDPSSWPDQAGKLIAEQSAE